MKQQGREFRSAGVIATIIVAMMLVTAGPLTADDVSGDMAGFVEHFEFLGYSVVEQQSESAVFAHPDELNLRVMRLQGGYLFMSYFTTIDPDLTNSKEFLAVVNQMNATAIANRYYVDRDGDLAVEAWYPGEYSRSHVGRIIAEWQSDWVRVSDTHGETLQEYLD